MALPNGKWVHPGVTQVKDPPARQGFDSLSKYLGGWLEWSGTFDLFFTAGSYTIGNAVKSAEYKLEGDMCDFSFEYKMGSTTTFPTGQIIWIKLPFLVAAFGTITRPAEGNAWAIKASNSLTVAARVAINSGNSADATHGAAYFQGPGLVQATGLQTEFTWLQDTTTPANSWPMYSGGNRVAWASGDIITGMIRFRAAL